MGRPSVPSNLAMADLENMRLPLNVNDSDLYPEMSDPPTEYSRFTEMGYCLLKYETHLVFRRSPHTAGITRGPQRLAELRSLPTPTKDQLVSEIESVYEQKYLQYCDPKVPLHYLAMIIARLAVSQMRLGCHHPRRNPNWSDPEETDLVFLNSVRLIEYDNLLRKTKFAQQLLRHLAARKQMDALICVLTELRRRTTGDLVETAWREVEIVFDDHPRLLEDTDNALFVSIGDLTLKAWETRTATATGPLSTPKYILSLLKTRSDHAALSVPKMTIPQSSLAKADDQAQPSAAQDVLDTDHHATESFPSNPGSTWTTDLPSVDWEFWEDLMTEPELDSYGQQALGYHFG